jgi:hypothetical protein
MVAVLSCPDRVEFLDKQDPKGTVFSELPYLELPLEAVYSFIDEDSFLIR